jgi:hypothetical protein
MQDACRYFLIESGFALFVAFLINIAMISVTGTVCKADDLSGENVDRCNDLTLNSASFLLKVSILVHFAIAMDVQSMILSLFLIKQLFISHMRNFDVHYH